MGAKKKIVNKYKEEGIGGVISAAALMVLGRVTRRKRVLDSSEMIALKNIEAQQGRRLSTNVKKRCLEYAREVLGNERYADWLNVYSALAGEFKEGWITRDYFWRIVYPQINGQYGKISSLRPLAEKLLNTDGMPNIAYYVNGMFFSPRWQNIPAEKVKSFLFECDTKVVFKVDNLILGKGVHVLTEETFDIDKIYEAGNGIFQKYIQQHEFFDEFNPKTVHTLRMVTVVGDNMEVSARQAMLILRIGQHKYGVPRVSIPVDLQSGHLLYSGALEQGVVGKKLVYLERFIDAHPDTNVTFSGKRIPEFGKVLAYCKKTHLNMPACRFISWDTIVDINNEIQLLEWEGGDLSWQFEALQGPCFADLGWERLWK